MSHYKNRLSNRNSRQETRSGFHTTSYDYSQDVPLLELSMKQTVKNLYIIRK